MPYPAYMRAHYKNKPLEGPKTICGEKNLFEILEYSHALNNETHFLDFYTRDQRRFPHTPVKIVMQPDLYLPLFYKIMTTSNNTNRLDKIEIFFPHFDLKGRADQIHVVVTLDPVKVCKVRQYFHNIKDQKFEKLGHQAEIWFRYRFVRCKCPDGNLETSKYEWRFFLAEFDNSGMDQEKVDQLLGCESRSDRFIESQKQAAAITLIRPEWKHTDSELRKYSGEKVAEGDTVQLSVETEGLDAGKEVVFDISLRSKNGAEPVATVSGKTDGGIALVEWCVDIDQELTEKDMLCFTAKAQNKSTKPCDIGISIDGAQISA